MNLSTLMTDNRSVVVLDDRGVNRALRRGLLAHPVSKETFEVYDVSSMFPDTDKTWTRALSMITGFAVHHDAVAFSGADVNFNGRTLDESLQRLRAIWQYHIDQGWNGIGYHAVIDLEGRIFIPRDDVIDTHRAHVSSATPNRTPVPAGKPNWNRQLVGVCFMGHYSDGRLPDGKAVGPLDDRPTTLQLQALDALCRTVTDYLQRPMTLRPHKFYQVKECPGSWVLPDAWGDVYSPTPAPAPNPPSNDAGLDLARVRATLDQVEAGLIEAERVVSEERLIVAELRKSLGG